jgi:hypothetical protein
MCGIIGYVSISDEVASEEKEHFLEDALILDTFRGMDSTGLLTLCEDFTLASHKTLDEGWDFVRTKEFWDMPNGWAAIGHNRAATKGVVSIENAHPFTDGPVSMVHNGTLNNMGRNLPNFCHKQDVDSMNICRALSHVGPDEATEVLKTLNGAYALVWADERDGSINMVRNSQRPLHFTHNTEKTVLWFMSDGGHLNMLKKRRWCGNADMGTVYQLGTHALLKFKKGSLIPEVTKYDPFVPPRHSSQTGHYSNQHGASSNASGAGMHRSMNTEDLRGPQRKVIIPSSHRIYLNGAVEVIPEAMLKDLEMVTDLAPEDTLSFTPERWVAYPMRDPAECGDDQRYGMAQGTVWVPDWETEWECVVHNVAEGHADKVSLKQWQVTPYGVSDASYGDYGCTIMAKIKKFGIPLEIPEKLGGWGIDDEIPFGDEEEEQTTLVGPFGRLFSTAEWVELTRHGCSNCSMDILPEDHEEVWWVGEMQREPLCTECCDEFTDNTLANKENIH